MPSDDYSEGRPAKWRKIQPPRRKKKPTSNSATQPFRFFDLPRELRDEIYDLLLDSQTCLDTTTDAGHTFDLSVMNGPRSSAFRVSTQFTSEYTEQMRLSASLEIHEVSSEELFLLPRIPALLASNCTRLNICKEAFTTEDMQYFLQGVEHLAKGFSNLKIITLALVSMFLELSECTESSHVLSWRCSHRGSCARPRR